jgi:hypothetical protein
MLPVQTDVEVRLIERARQERRVDGEDRDQAGMRHTCRARHGMLLGDADVDDAVR